MIDRRMTSCLQAGQAIAAKDVVPPLHSSTTAPGGGSIGRPIPRLEDERLLRGGSRYVSDLIATSNALRIGVLRSPHAHACIVAIDAGKARAMPGVIAGLTADDLADVDELPCDWDPPGTDPVPKHPVLAHGRVRYAGQPIAVVAAEAAQAAEEALATIVVTYQPLPAVVDQESAMADGAPCLHDAAASNIAFRFRRSSGNVARAFANADIIIRRRFINSRVTAAPLEGRAVLSDFDGRSGRLTHHTSSQLPHIHARSLGKCLGLPLHKLRLVAPDIGGGFGSKLGFYAEDVLCALLAAPALGRKAAVKAFWQPPTAATRSNMPSLPPVATGRSARSRHGSSPILALMHSGWDQACPRSILGFRSPASIALRMSKPR